MLKECLEVFQEQLDRSDGKLVLDTYIPADGTYLVVDKDGNIKINIDIVKDKKTKSVDRNIPGFGEICFYDYQSQLISMNKPMDSKKVIHSNSYLSFFVKKESIVTGKLTEPIIDDYYEVLKDPLGKKYKKSKEATRIYELFEVNEGKVDEECVERNRGWVKEHIFQFQDIDLKRKDYLKLFFKADREEYEREGRRYFLPNIYNSNDYNTEIQEVVYGMPDNNLGMNAKKPFLSVKSRKNPAPYLLNSDEVILQKQFFDYLMNLVSAGKYHVYVDTHRRMITGYANGEAPDIVESGYYLRLRKGKTEAEISEQDNIVGYRRKLEPAFQFQNILESHYEKHPEYEKYGTYNDRVVVGNLIDEVFYRNFLGSNYTTDAGDMNVKENMLKKNILLSRDVIFAWVFKGINCGVGNILQQIALDMMKECALKNYIERVWWQFDLMYSLQEYFSEGKGENMSEIISKLREDVKSKVCSSEVVPIASDDEYYYCVGQLARYLLTLSKAKDRTHALLNPILNAKTDATIKTRLLQMYKKYNYNILDHYKKVNNLLAMVEGYVPESGKQVDQEKILLGYVSDSAIFNAKEDK